MPLQPVAIPPETLARLAALDARCDWTVTRGCRRINRVYWCRVWERGVEASYLEGSTLKFYRSTLADAFFGIVLAAEARGWHKPK